MFWSWNAVEPADFKGLPLKLAKTAGFEGGADRPSTQIGRSKHALSAGNGEPLGQFLGRPVEINVLFEPVKGDFHFVKRLIVRSPAI